MVIGAVVSDFYKNDEKNSPHFGKYIVVRESTQQVLGKYSTRLWLNAPILQIPYNELNYARNSERPKEDQQSYIILCCYSCGAANYSAQFNIEVILTERITFN